MRFSLSTEQTALRDAVRELLALRCPPSVVARAWSDGDVGGVWAALAEMGIFAAAVPADRGGLGLAETDLVAVLEEIGYAAVPWPVAETMAVAAALLAAVDDPRLSRVLAGDLRVAIAGPGGLVPYGRRADLVLELGDGQARLGAPCASTPESTVDGSRAAMRTHLPADATITDDPDLVELAADRADLATAAQLVGLGRRMLHMTTAYVGVRRQFGVPVGTFQAVQHRLADALLTLEFAAPAVLAAGWALANQTPARRRDVSMAAVLSCDAARATAKAAIQCHGAIGYTVEYDLHLFAKRAWALAATVRTDVHLERLADALDLGGALT